jgi:hypothetical protein
MDHPVATVVRAAYEGRVSDLWVAEGAHRWGKFEPESEAVSVRERPDAAGEDLLNLAAIHAFTRGGRLHAVDRARVPDGGDIAAIFRY